LNERDKPSKIDGFFFFYKVLKRLLLLTPKQACINEDLRYWDEDSNSWKLEEGEYLINIGNSSRNISLSQVIKI